MPARQTGPGASQAANESCDTGAGPDPPRTRAPGLWPGPVPRMHLGPARTSAAPAPDEDVLPRARLHSSSADNRDESLDGCAGRVRSGCLPTARSTTSHFTSTTAPEWRPGGRETCGAAGRLAADRLPVPGKTTPGSRESSRAHRAASSTVADSRQQGSMNLSDACRCADIRMHDTGGSPRRGPRTAVRAQRVIGGGSRLAPPAQGTSAELSGEEMTSTYPYSFDLLRQSLEEQYELHSSQLAELPAAITPTTPATTRTPGSRSSLRPGGPFPISRMRCAGWLGERTVSARAVRPPSPPSGSRSCRTPGSAHAAKLRGADAPGHPGRPAAAAPSHRVRCSAARAGSPDSDVRAVGHRRRMGLSFLSRK